VRVLTTLNPAGMDRENWRALGIPADFAEKQELVLEAFSRMGVSTTCTCTPYLAGNLPGLGDHLAWSESSAVCYANAVLGARTNREGGPSALAAALTGRTPGYGMHIPENRLPSIAFHVEPPLLETRDFGALGKVIGQKVEASKAIPYISGVSSASLENLKSFCASLATYGGVALFHMAGITPEAGQYPHPAESLTVTQPELEECAQSLNDADSQQVDFVSLGCPHLSLPEIAHLASLLQGQKVKKEFWVTTSRPVKHVAERMGYTRIIEEAGAKFAVDTCCVVAPIRDRFSVMATDSAKACYYAYAKNKFKTLFLPFDEVVKQALQ
jgi:predicted aconitase